MSLKDKYSLDNNGFVVSESDRIPTEILPKASFEIENIEESTKEKTLAETFPGDKLHNDDDLKETKADKVSTFDDEGGDCCHEEESKPDKVETQVYFSRFWILGLFSYTAFIVIVIWGTFGPIMKSAEYAFGWSDGFIALLEGFGPFLSVMCIIPFNWTTQKYGLRVGMLLVSFLITLATGVRCISIDENAFTYLVSVGAFLNGMASCLTLSLPPMLSSVWFPKEERASATAVGALATQFAVAGMYLSPLIVRSPEDDVSEEDVRGDIRTLMFIHFGLSILSLVCTLIYFPKEPPKPPSVSSSMGRIDYFKSIKILIKNRNVMFVVLCYVFSYSIPICWVSVMNFSLDCLGVTQDQTMWIGITACSLSPLLSFIVARMTDYIYGYLKLSIIVLFIGASSFFLWFLLISEGVIAPSLTQIAISIVCAVSFQYSTVPLLMELSVELAYPCPESVVGGLLSFLLDTCDSVFLLLMMIPSDCYYWLSYALVASCSLTILPMLFVKEVYHRTDVDTKPKNNPKITSPA